MTDQNRPMPSPTQPDPEDINTPGFRPQSSSSRRTIQYRKSLSRPRPQRHGNSSSTSIDSTALLDHRDQPQSLSRHLTIPYTTSQSHGRRSSHFPRRPRPDGEYSSDEISDHDDVQEEGDDETMRLMSMSARQQSFAPWTKPRPKSMDESDALLGSSEQLDTYGSSSRPFTSGGSPSRTTAGRRASPTKTTKYTPRFSLVNHPSSIPSSIGSPPPRGRQISLVGTGADGEILSMPLAQRVQRRLTQTGVPSQSQGGDVLIDIEPPGKSATDLSALPPIILSPEHSSIRSSSAGSLHSRRRSHKVEEDVCFPTEEPSYKAPWPDYEVLEEWAAQESKSLDEGSAAARSGERGFFSREGHRKISEPVMVDGRYRRGHNFPSATAMYEVSFSIRLRLMM